MLRKFSLRATEFVALSTFGSQLCGPKVEERDLFASCALVRAQNLNLTLQSSS